jgi:AraC-like DNA-binding protein
VLTGNSCTPRVSVQFSSNSRAMARRWVASQRIEEIARRCGLGSTDNFRLYFRRHLRTTPSAYRRAFSSAAADHV